MQTDFPLVPVNFDFDFVFMGTTPRSTQGSVLLVLHTGINPARLNIPYGVLGIKSWLTTWKANAQISYLLYYSSIDSWLWNMGLHFCFFCPQILLRQNFDDGVKGLSSAHLNLLALRLHLTTRLMLLLPAELNATRGH